MSKYTTELRYICEQKAGLDESVGCDDVDRIIAGSWDKIFTTQCEFFDESYRVLLCSKILKHFYLREIGAETVGVWKLWMNTKLEEVMPYYNLLYKSALLDINPLLDVDYTKEHEGVSDGAKNTEGSGTVSGRKNGTNVTTGGDTVTTEGTKTTTGRHNDSETTDSTRNVSVSSIASATGSKGDRYSDTPQGTIANADVEGNAYLTNVRLINDSTSGSSTDTTTDGLTETKSSSGGVNTTEGTDMSTTTDKNETVTVNETNNVNTTNSSDETVHNTDSFVERVFGKMSNIPQSELLMKFRETFLNIDMMVIEEFDELFMSLW